MRDGGGAGYFAAGDIVLILPDHQYSGMTAAGEDEYDAHITTVFTGAGLVTNTDLGNGLLSLYNGVETRIDVTDGLIAASEGVVTDAITASQTVIVTELDEDDWTPPP